SRVVSFTSSTPPNSLRTASRASLVFSPRSTRSRAAISKWPRTSSSSSFSRVFRHHPNRINQPPTHCHQPASSVATPCCSLLGQFALHHTVFIYFVTSLFLCFLFLFMPQRHHWIDAHRPPRRNIACSHSRSSQQQRHATKDPRIARIHPI